ncbi:hypothetical protein DFJ73DRAFT_839662 [Zopfochytrium polystomum]|nr:hypothetical protein DFJ73DRAFT_839662 [Zopfochytrium polystomum]
MRGSKDAPMVLEIVQRYPRFIWFVLTKRGAVKSTERNSLHLQKITILAEHDLVDVFSFQSFLLRSKASPYALPTLLTDSLRHVRAESDICIYQSEALWKSGAKALRSFDDNLLSLEVGTSHHPIVIEIEPEMEREESPASGSSMELGDRSPANEQPSLISEDLRNKLQSARRKLVQSWLAERMRKWQETVVVTKENADFLQSKGSAALILILSCHDVCAFTAEELSNAVKIIRTLRVMEDDGGQISPGARAVLFWSDQASDLLAIWTADSKLKDGVAKVVQRSANLQRIVDILNSSPKREESVPTESVPEELTLHKASTPSSDNITSSIVKEKVPNSATAEAPTPRTANNEQVEILEKRIAHTKANGASPPSVGFAKVMHSFSASDPAEVSLTAGEVLEVLDSARNWWKIRKFDNEGKQIVGIAPSNYLDLLNPVPDGSEAIAAAALHLGEAKLTYRATHPLEISIEPGELFDILQMQGRWWLIRKTLPNGDMVAGNVPAKAVGIVKAPTAVAGTAETLQPPPRKAGAARPLSPPPETAPPRTISMLHPEKRRSNALLMAQVQEMMAQVQEVEAQVQEVKATSPTSPSPPTALVLFSYSANPKDPAEVSMAQGELVQVLNNQGNWWTVKKADGSIGIAPFNFLAVQV